MKKALISFILLLLFVPVLVNAETCDNDKVYIDSISTDKNNNVEEITPSTADGKNINLTLRVSNIGDNIRYKIVIKNDSNEDYIVDKNSINISSKYMDYTIESDNSNIVKAKSSKAIYLRVNYSNPVPEDAYIYGTVNDEVNMKVNLSTSNNLSNPNTGIKYYIMISLIVIIMILSLIIFRKKRLSKVMILIISLSIFIPISVYALCRCDISINSTVLINKKSVTGTIYRNDKEQLRIGDSFLITTWAVLKQDSNEMEEAFFESKEECNELLSRAVSEGILNENEYYCRIVSFPKIGDYKDDPSQLNSDYYIKDEIKNNIVTNTQVCFTTDKEVCFKPGSDSVYEENVSILRNEEEWFNNHGGNCDFIGSTNHVSCTAEEKEVRVSHFFDDTWVKKKRGIICTAISCDNGSV